MSGSPEFLTTILAYLFGCVGTVIIYFFLLFIFEWFETRKKRNRARLFLEYLKTGESPNKKVDNPTHETNL